MMPFIVIPAIIGLVFGTIGMISGIVRNVFIIAILGGVGALVGYVFWQEFIAK